MSVSQTHQEELCSLYGFFLLFSHSEEPLEDVNPKSLTDHRSISIGHKLIKPDLATLSKSKDNLWVFTFQKQPLALRSFLNRKGISNYANFKYGIFDKTFTPPGATNLSAAPHWNDFVSKKTTIFDDIWEEFPTKVKMFFGNKKDSWSTSDVYIFNGTSNEETTILDNVKKLASSYDDAEGAAMFLGPMNEYLQTLYHQNKLIGISLKQATYPNIPTPTETNISYSDDFDPPNMQYGEIGTQKKIWQNMLVTATGGSLDFETSSFVIDECKISPLGTKVITYYWESKPGKRTYSLQTTEMKKKVGSTREGVLKVASAKTGGIPKPEFRTFMNEYLNSPHSIDYCVPTNDSDSLSVRERGILQSLVDELKENSLIDFKEVAISYRLGSKFIKTPSSSYIEDLYWIFKNDGAAVKSKYGVPKHVNFNAMFANKIRGMWYAKAILNAKNSGKLGELLVRAFYKASKINITVDDVKGPFVLLS